jgi:hypothetical protein
MRAIHAGDIYRTEEGEVVLICQGQNVVGRLQLFVMLENGRRRFYPLANMQEWICNVKDFDALREEPDATVARFLQLVRNHETGKRLNAISG